MSRVVFPVSSPLLKRLDEIRAAARPGSRAINRIRGDLQQIVAEGHAEMMLGDVDRHGKPRAPLAKSTLRRRKGSGPSLVPRGMGSRFVANFHAIWSGDALVGILEGMPWAKYHLEGGRHLPRRDVGGMTPRTRERIAARHAQLPGEILRSGGG